MDYVPNIIIPTPNNSFNRSPRPQKFNFPPGFLRLDPGKRLLLLDQIIKQHGYRVLYQRHQICACVRENAGVLTPQPDCNTCNGTGRTYLQDFETVAIVTSVVSSPMNYDKFGKLEKGTISATFLSTVTPNFNDRFRLIDVLVPLTQNFSINDLDSDNSLYLDWFPQEIISVTAFDSSKNSVIILNESKDYALDVDNKKLFIMFPNLTNITSFSVLYNGTPYYYVMQIPHQYRGVPMTFQEKFQTFVKLPTNCLARRGDLEILEESNLL